MTLPNINNTTGESSNDNGGKSTKECMINNISSGSFQQEKFITNGTNRENDISETENLRLKSHKNEYDREFTSERQEYAKQKELFKTIRLQGDLTDHTYDTSFGRNNHVVKPTPTKQARKNFRIRFADQQPLVTRSLPTSPVMSPRLLRRTKEKAPELFQSVKLPSPPKHGKTTTARRPVIQHPGQSRTDMDSRLVDEEIQMLNLSSSHPTDDFLLSLEPNEQLLPPGSLTNHLFKTPENNSRLFTRRKSVSLPDSPTETPTFDSQPSKEYLVTRRRTVAYDRSIQLRKTFEEWLDVKSEESRRRSLNLQNTKEIEQFREEQLRKVRFERSKTFDEWKHEKEEIMKQQTFEAKEKQREEIEQKVEKDKQNEELRMKKYNDWLLKKFERELAEEEKKIQELRNEKNKEKLNLRRLNSK